MLTNEGGDSSFLVDAGDGTLRDLAKRHFDFRTLKAVLITHEHADHTGGLFALIHFLKHMPHPDPLYIVSPRPITYLRKFFQRPLMYGRIPFKVVFKEAEAGKKFKVDQFEILPFRAMHVDFDSIGYSIKDLSDRYRVVVSGDTIANDKLRNKVRGSDLAILESTFEDGQEKFAKTFGHMTVSQARAVGQLAKKSILVHEMPQDYFEMMTCAVLPNEN